MDFGLSDEQRMLADLVGRYVQKNHGDAVRSAAAQKSEGFSRARWATLAETGLLGLNVAPEQGGLGGKAADCWIVMQAFGRGLVQEPYVSTAVIGARLLGLAGSTPQKERWLPSIVDGSRLFALATLEPGARYDLWQVAATARRTASGWVLDGAKALVPGGDSADVLLVSARVDASDSRQDTAGIGVFIVPADAPGLSRQSMPTFDGRRGATIRLSAVQLSADALLGESASQAGGSYEKLEWAIGYGVAALCAEAAGAMRQLLDLTLAHLRARHQFGKSIGSFQALQHRAAEMLVSTEQATSMALMAAAYVDGDDAAARRRALSAAKALVGRCARHVGQTAIQLHGGMGMTDELAAGHYFKRLTAIDKTWGDADHHTGLFAQSM
jgi:alkylation response protein AidB-like acyl-CoA dehydrogenase